MPSLPAPLAARAERWFGRPAAVVEVTELSPGLVRVGFLGPHWRGRPWIRGQEVEFRVGDREFRHYTAADVDPDRGRFDVVFVRHGEAPGTAWLAGLDVGTEVGVMGPGGGLRRGLDRRELFLGDATALGLFAALIPTAGDARGAVEVPAADVAAAAALVPDLAVVATGAAPGSALDSWLGVHADDLVRNDDPPPDQACLAGHVGTIDLLRRRIRTELGLPRRAVVTKAHWTEGRKGL